MPNVDIIIPAYNEEDNIGLLIKGIQQALANTDFRILVVDDASEDKTAQVAGEAGAEVIHQPYHLGNGASIKTGLRHARADIAVLMDADGQHGPEDITRLLSEIDRFDMVIGARNFSRITLRNFANIIYNTFASYVTQFQIKDLTSGFRAVKRDTAQKFLYLLPNGFSYPSTITLAFLKAGRTIKYIPVSGHRRAGGRSKIRLFQDGARFLLIIVKVATLFSPLRVFLPVSLFFFSSGLAYYIYTYLYYHRFTNMGVLLFSASIIILMLGLISDQISQLRMDRTEI